MISDEARGRIIALSNRLAPELVAPPHDGPGVCSTCRTWNDAEPHHECSNCADVRAMLSTEPIPISVISLYRKPSVLRNWLTQYKGRPEDEEDPLLPEFRSIIIALMGRFLIEHGQQLQERTGGYDVITVVPSTSREPPHPLEDIARELWTNETVVRPLTRGAGDLGFRKAAKNGYIATNCNVPSRILLIDDVYTTGARINSAAFALRSKGFEIAGGVVFARRVNVDFDPRAKELWEIQSRRPFQWDRSPIVPWTKPHGVDDEK